MRPYRVELKFLIHHSVRTLLMERWSRYLVRAPFTDEHAVTPILSQYYDSPSLLFYREKLDGIELRNKVRIRTYGLAFERARTTFLEIKRRWNDRVTKIRYRFPQFELHHLDPRRWSFEEKEVGRPFLYLLERHRLRPSAGVYYQREAYEGAVETDLRVTFDTCLTGLYAGEALTGSLLLDRSRRLMDETLVILEVKATKQIPPWVHDGIVAAELRQATIPKYVSAVEKLGLHSVGQHGQGV